MIVTPNLKYWAGFENSLKDGSKNDIIYTESGAIPGDYIGGKFGRGFQFNGNFNGSSGSNIIGDQTIFITNELTVSFWIKYAVANNFVRGLVGQNYARPGDGGWGFFTRSNQSNVCGGADSLRFVLRPPQGNLNYQINYCDISVGEWEHIFVRCKRDSGLWDIEFYANMNLVGSFYGVSGPNLDVSDHFLTLGNRRNQENTGFDDHYSNSAIDEVQVYDKWISINDARRLRHNLHPISI